VSQNPQHYPLAGTVSVRPRARCRRAAVWHGDARPLPEEPAEWHRPAGDYATSRYSPLDQIDTRNASRLALAWTFPLGVLKGQKSAPLAVGGTLYVVTPYPNILYAFDLGRSGAALKKYEPNPAPASQGVACRDVVNRGAVYADGRIIYNTLDARTVAVDVHTGKELWRTRLGDIAGGETIDAAVWIAEQGETDH
jgi:alcohol dehydrogenase (cytochrome c)